MFTLLVTEKSVLDSIKLSTKTNNLAKAICKVDLRFSDINLKFNSLGYIAGLVNKGKLFTNDPERDTRNFAVIKLPETAEDVKHRLLVLTDVLHPLAGNLTVTLFSVEKIYLHSVAYFKYSVDYNLFNWYVKAFNDKDPEDTILRIFVDALRYKHIED